MGVVNVTPDSFSDGGLWLDPEPAIAHGVELAAEGAAILDIGGESTRPGAQPVGAEEELRRTLPVIEGLAAARTGARLSIDTVKRPVAAAALAAGASYVNDVSAFRADPEMAALVAEHGCDCCLMHMQGEPRTMQSAPHYDDAAAEVCNWLAGRAAACVAAGIPAGHIAVDPGIGFGKTLAHNLAILAGLGRYRGLPHALLLGVSRKSFISSLDRAVPAKQRLGGSLAVALACVRDGAHILRVHDVGDTRQALAVERALVGSR